jgi:hypothetical protein
MKKKVENTKVENLQDPRNPVLPYYSAMMDEETKPILDAALKNLKPGEGVLVVVRQKPGDNPDVILESTIQNISEHDSAAWVAMSNKESEIQDDEWQSLVTNLHQRCTELRMPINLFKQANEKLKANDERQVHFGVLGRVGEKVDKIVAVVHQQINMGLNGDLVLHEGDVVLQTMYEKIFSKGRPIELLTYGAGGSASEKVNPGHLSLSQGVLDFRTHVDPISVINYLVPRVQSVQDVPNESNLKWHAYFLNLKENVLDKFNNDPSYSSMEIIEDISNLVHIAANATGQSPHSIMKEFTEDKKNYFADICFGSIKSGNTNVKRITGDYRGEKGHEQLKKNCRTFYQQVGDAQAALDKGAQDKAHKEFINLKEQCEQVAFGSMGQLLTELTKIYDNFLADPQAKDLDSKIAEVIQNISLFETSVIKQAQEHKGVPANREKMNESIGNLKKMAKIIENRIEFQKMTTKYNELHATGQGPKDLMALIAAHVKQEAPKIQTGLLDIKSSLSKRGFKTLSDAVNSIVELSQGELDPKQFSKALHHYNDVAKKINIDSKRVNNFKTLMNNAIRPLENWSNILSNLTNAIHDVDALRDDQAINLFYERYAVLAHEVRDFRVPIIIKNIKQNEQKIISSLSGLDSKLSKDDFNKLNKVVTAIIQLVKDNGDSTNYAAAIREYQETIKNIKIDRESLNYFNVLIIPVHIESVDKMLHHLLEKTLFRDEALVAEKLSRILSTYNQQHQQFVIDHLKHDTTYAVAKNIREHAKEIQGELLQIIVDNLPETKAAHGPPQPFRILEKEVNTLIDLSQKDRIEDPKIYIDALSRYQQAIKSISFEEARPLKMLMDSALAKGNGLIAPFFKDYQPLDGARIQALTSKFPQLGSALEKLENHSAQLAQQSTGDFISYLGAREDLTVLINDARTQLKMSVHNKELSTQLDTLENAINNPFAQKITTSGNVFFTEHDKAASQIYGSQTVEMENNLFIQLFNHNLRRFNVIGANVTKIAADPYVIETQITEELNNWAASATFTLQDYMDAYRWAEAGQSFKNFEKGRWDAAENLYKNPENSDLRKRLWDVSEEPKNPNDPRIVNPYWKEIGTDMLREIEDGKAFSLKRIEKLIQSKPELVGIKNQLQKDAKEVNTSPSLSKEDKDKKVEAIFKVYLDNFLQTKDEKRYKIYARFTPLLQQGFVEPVIDWDQAIYKSSNTPILTQLAPNFYEKYRGERVVGQGAVIPSTGIAQAPSSDYFQQLEKQRNETINLPFDQFAERCMLQLKKYPNNPAIVFDIRNQVRQHVLAQGFPLDINNLILLKKLIKPYAQEDKISESGFNIEYIRSTLIDVHVPHTKLVDKMVIDAVLDDITKNGLPSDWVSFQSMLELISYVNEGLRMKTQQSLKGEAQVNVGLEVKELTAEEINQNESLLSPQIKELPEKSSKHKVEPLIIEHKKESSQIAYGGTFFKSNKYPKELTDQGLQANRVTIPRVVAAIEKIKNKDTATAIHVAQQFKQWAEAHHRHFKLSEINALIKKYEKSEPQKDDKSQPDGKPGASH